MSWPMVALGEVAEIERRSVFAADIKSGTAYVGLEDIDAGGANVRTQTVEAGDIASNKFAFDDEHILFGKLRPYLAKIASAPGEGVCSTDILPIRARQNMDRGFLLHFLRQPSQVSKAAARASGANLPRLSPRELVTFDVPLPPLPEQRRIAGILDAADALRRRRRRAIETLDTLQGALFAEMFGVTRISAGDWPVVPFGELVKDSLIGLVRGAKDIQPDGPIPYLKMDAITTTGRIDHRKIMATTASDKEIARFALRRGDLLFNTRNTRELVGKAAVFDGPNGIIYNNNIMRIRTTERATPDFLAEYLRSPFGAIELAKRKSGTTSVFAVYAKNLMTLPTPVPPVELVERFSEIVKSMRVRRTAMTTHLANLETLFSALQSRAFAGDL